METTHPQPPAQTAKFARTKRSSTVCQCESQKPTPQEFTQPDMIGVCCSECLHVLSWESTKGTKKTSKKSEPKPKPQYGVKEEGEFNIMMVLPISEEECKMKWRLRDTDGTYFDVVLDSTREKVASAINKKVIWAGRTAVVEFHGRHEGKPIDPKVVRVLKP